MPVLILLSVLLLFAVAVMSPTTEGKHLNARRYLLSRQRDQEHLGQLVLYEKTRMFTEAEKECYSQLQAIVSSSGYSVFAKVPLSYIIYPRTHCRGFRAALDRVDSVCADFVISDKNLKTCLVLFIECSDADVSKSSASLLRLEAALQQCGVKVLHTVSIDSDACAWVEDCLGLSMHS